MSSTEVLAVDVDVDSGRVSIETPSQAPQPKLPGDERRSRRRRPRAVFIRDIRRLVETSWLAKVGQYWRWTPYDRECLYQLAIRRPAWEIMALWDCYLERPFREVKVPHFCQPDVLDRLADDSRYRLLAAMYRGRLYNKQGMYQRLRDLNVLRG